MDSEALKTFLAIRRTGGFSTAADALHRSQPAISRRIKELEAQLKVPLFERTGSGVVLSDAGRALLPFAERVLATIDDATNAIAALRTGNAGTIALAVVGTLAGTSLTATLKRFAKQFPGVDVTLRTATSAEVSDLVRAGDATIGLRYHDDPAGDLVNHALAHETLVVICARNHRLAGKTVAKFTDLRSDRWLAFPVVPTRREAAAQGVHTQFLMRGVDGFAWTPVDSLTAQKRLVEANYGIALVPESAITEERTARTVATIRVRDLKAANPVFAVTRKHGYLSNAAARLIEFLKSGWR
jgi:DNA-binding transcriptional LysR family regulator